MTSKPSEFLTFLEYFINDYLNIIAGYSKNTIKSYKYSFKLFFDFMLTEKNKTPDQITFKSVNASVMLGFMKWLKEKRGCCQSTLQQRLAAFLTFSEYAQNRNFDAACSFRNGVLSVPRRTVPKKNIAFFTVNEMEILLKTPDDTTEIGYRDLILMSVMYASGARAQEICDLTVGSIIFDSERTSLIIHGKGEKTRSLFMMERTVSHLKEYLQEFHQSSDPTAYLFNSNYKGKHQKLSQTTFRTTFKKYAEIARSKCEDVPADIHPHMLRHARATHMLEDGLNIAQVSEFLGHASINTTQVYLDISFDLKSEAMQKLENEEINNMPKKWKAADNTTSILSSIVSVNRKN